MLVVIEQIGVKIFPLTYGCMMDPPADREYAVDPDEDDMMMPSANTFRKNLLFKCTFSLAM